MTWVSQSYYTGCGRFMERGSADPDPACAPRPGVGYLHLALKMVVLPTMRSKYRSGVIQCPTKLSVGDRTSRFVIWGGASAQRVTQNNLSPDDGWYVPPSVPGTQSMYYLILAHPPGQNYHGRTTIHYNALIRLICDLSLSLESKLRAPQFIWSIPISLAWRIVFRPWGKCFRNNQRALTKAIKGLTRIPLGQYVQLASYVHFLLKVCDSIMFFVGTSSLRICVRLYFSTAHLSRPPALLHAEEKPEKFFVLRIPAMVLSGWG